MKEGYELRYDDKTGRVYLFVGEESVEWSNVTDAIADLQETLNRLKQLVS